MAEKIVKIRVDLENSPEDICNFKKLKDDMLTVDTDLSLEEKARLISAKSRKRFIKIVENIKNGKEN